MAAGADAGGAGVPPAIDASQSVAEATATLADDLAATTSATSPEAGQSDGAETVAGHAAAPKTAPAGLGHPSRQLAHQILGQSLAAVNAKGTSRQASGETPASTGPTGDLAAVASPESADAREPARPGRVAIGARVRADAGSDRATSAVAPFLDSSADAGQDQRGGASRGGRAWSFAWATAAEMPRTAVKTSGGQPAGGAFSIAPGAQATPVLGAGPAPAAAGGAPPAMAAPTATPLADADMARQVVRAVSLAWHDQVGEARLHLTPEHLGDVTVSLRVERGIVSAVLQADTPAARDWIRLHENDLRQGLESQGLHLDSLVVTEDGTSQGRQDQQAPPRQPRRRPASPDAPRFEIRV